MCSKAPNWTPADAKGSPSTKGSAARDSLRKAVAQGLGGLQRLFRLVFVDEDFHVGNPKRREVRQSVVRGLSQKPWRLALQPIMVPP